MSKTKQYPILCALVLLPWVDPIGVTPNLTCWVQFKWHSLADKHTAVATSVATLIFIGFFIYFFFTFWRGRSMVHVTTSEGMAMLTVSPTQDVSKIINLSADAGI